jgi:hypothetical protein
MLVLRCTKKAFRKMGAAPRYADVTIGRPTVGEWYVNTVDFINGGDLLLACMHAESLYVLLVPIQPPVTVDQLVNGLQLRLQVKFLELETPPDVARRVLAAYRGEAILAGTKNRQAVGHMNSALQDLRKLLAIPALQVCDGDTILGARIEHRLNTSPRGLEGTDVIWPLSAFWQCVRKLCPELPAKVPLLLLSVHDEKGLRRVRELLHAHLPGRLARKMHIAFQDVEALFDADELRILAETLDEKLLLREGLARDDALFLARQVQTALEEILGQRA